MTADQNPLPNPPTPVHRIRSDRATPFGGVTPTAPHWPGSSEPPASRSALAPVESDNAPSPKSSDNE